MDKNDESQEGDDSRKEPEGSSDCQENQEQPKSPDKKELVPDAGENTPKEKADTNAHNGNSSPASDGSASEAVRVQPPKGKLAGSYLAIAIVISVLALIGLGCGIARTVIASHASTPSGQVVSSTASATNSSQSSSTPSNNTAQNCTPDVPKIRFSFFLINMPILPCCCPGKTKHLLHELADLVLHTIAGRCLIYEVHHADLVLLVLEVNCPAVLCLVKADPVLV